MSSSAMDEPGVLLGVEVMDQPTPTRNEGGDCFACAVGAALRHLFPDKCIGFDDASELFLQENGAYSCSWIGVRKALYEAASDLPLEVTRDLVKPRWDTSTWSHAWYSRGPGETRYCRRLEAWLSAGWIALAAVHMDGALQGVKGGGHCLTDHFVLFDGVRRTVVEEEDVTRVDREIHVVDSSTHRPDYRWQKGKELLDHHGAAAWWLVRRDKLRAPR